MTQTKPKEATSFTSKWKTYPAYKDSGVEWLGEIPEHWEVKRLKFTCKINPSKSDTSHLPIDMEVSFLPMELIGEDGAITLEETRLIGQVRQGYTYFRNGDVIIAKITPCFENGKGALCKGLVNSIGFGTTEIYVLRPNEEGDPEFIFYVTKSEPFREIGAAMMQGAAGQQRVPEEFVSNFQISFPSLPEQHSITSFLDRETAKINTLIAKKERLIKLLQERRSALISHAVTKGLDPTVKMKNSGVEWLGEIPEHWEVRRLKYIASILRGKFSHRPRNDPRMYDGPYPFIQTGDITATAKYITAYQQTLNETGFAVSKQFPSGTLVMAIAANIGDLAILQFSACFPDSIVGFVPTFDVALDYLYYNLTSMKPEMMSTATLNTQLNLNVERIGGLITTCPPLREQIAIANYLEQETAKIDALISRIRDGIEKLKEYSTALISAAVTGKIDVRGETTTLEDKDL